MLCEYDDFYAKSEKNKTTFIKYGTLNFINYKSPLILKSHCINNTDCLKPILIS